MTTPILVLIICIVLSFFFSATETAFTAVSDIRMRALAKEGSRSAKTVLKLRQNPDRFLSVILFGNNVVNITLTAVCTALCVSLFGRYWGVLAATFGVSFLVLIFCEIIPKSYAIRNPNRIALFGAQPLAVFTYILAPILVFLNALVRSLMKSLGLLRREHFATSAKLELKGALEQHNGADIKSQRPMLKSVLELDEVILDDIMTHRKQMVSFNIDTPLSELKQQIAACPYTRVPMWEKSPDKIVGVLHAKVFFRLLSDPRTQDQCLEKALMAPWFVLNTTSVLKQLQAFKQRREHFALVIDEYGVLQGLVTLEDVLEEIVGDIVDETDRTSNNGLFAQMQKDGSVIADGSYPLRDLNRQFGWNLPDEQASTLAGLLLYETERIPRQDIPYSFYGYTFQVINKQGNQLVSIRITPQQPAPSPVAKD